MKRTVIILFLCFFSSVTVSGQFTYSTNPTQSTIVNTGEDVTLILTATPAVSGDLAYLFYAGTYNDSGNSVDSVEVVEIETNKLTFKISFGGNYSVNSRSGILSVSYYGEGVLRSFTLVYTQDGFGTALCGGQIASSVGMVSPGVTPPPITSKMSAFGGGGGPYTYSWYISNSGEPRTWRLISGATSESYSPPISTTNKYYRRHASNANGSAYSNTVIIKVRLEPFAKLTYENNSYLTLSLKSENIGGKSPYVYQWQVSDDSNSWVNIQGSTASDDTLVEPSSNKYYRLYVASSDGQSAYTPSVTTFLSKDGGYIKNSISIRTFIDTSYLYKSEEHLFDGLGRLYVSYLHYLAPQERDVAVFSIYDDMGRVSKGYLPAMISTYSKNIIYAQKNFYTNYFSEAEADAAYSVTKYDGSPLSRVVSSMKAGAPYHSASKEVVYGYSVNVVSEVPMLQYSYLDHSITYSGTYPAGALTKETVTDEDGGESIIYKDSRGVIILQKKKLSLSEYACTYYLYDDHQRLVWVITPKGYDSLVIGTNYSISSSLALNHSHIYIYGVLDRLSWRRLSNRGVEKFIYDRGGRMVLYQDGLLSSGNKWHYYVYDNINRIVEESIVASSLSQAEIQSIYYNNSFNNTYPYIGGQSDYRKPLSGSSFSLEEHLFSARYGDYPYLTSYSGGVTSEFSIHSDLSFLPISGVVSQSDIDSRISNLKLYEKLAILGGGGTFVERAYYYDYLGRVVQKVERNHLGGISRTSVKYDFTGNILQVNESHQKSPGGVSEVKNSLYAYDEHGRVVSENSNLLGGASGTVLYEYNEIGKLSKRSFGNGASETMTYNVQGWQQSNITKGSNNNNIYTQTLYYYNPSLSQSTASYSGNVSEWGWMQGTNTTNRYSFLYDASSRLLSSTRYNHIGTAYNSFTERDISYDKNGNITALKRYGTSNSSPTDNLTYSYNGNILSTLYNSTGSLSSTYSYDLNGNLSFDGRKNLHFEYNILNLASVIKENGTLKAEYKYLSDGTKLSVTDANGTGYDYLGSLTYSKSGNIRTLESTDFSSGRIVKSGNSTTPYYYIADHLGSTRVILDNSQNVLWRSDYYPYGTLHNSGNSYPITIPNRYTFSGKEEQTTGTLDLLDFGARDYDRTLCRWMTQDPLSSKYPGISQYVYCVNNPVRYVDPDGERNIPALLWAAKNMVNKGIKSNYKNAWFGNTDNRWVYKIGEVPDRAVCYESCFIAYMNSGEEVLQTLRTGFTNMNNAFISRLSESGGINWFRSGDGKDRQLVTDISKGELGDIVFMGEDKPMLGHAVLLASEVAISTIMSGNNKVQKATFYALSTSSNTDKGNFGGKEYSFIKQKDGTWLQDGGEGYMFKGFGQMTNIKTDDEDIETVKNFINSIKQLKK